jgi:hypothetical protein
VSHDAVSKTENIASESPGYGQSFTAISSVGTTAQGHVNEITTKTVTLPALEDTTYTLSAGNIADGASVNLADDSGARAVQKVNFNGTTNEVVINKASGSDDINIGLPNTVITRVLKLTGVSTARNTLEVTSGVARIATNLEVTGTATFTGSSASFTSEVVVPTAVASTSAVNLGQVQGLISGQGGFQGSYNASTNTPALTGSNNVALANGDYYAVSVGGQFFTETVSPGDFIYANGAIAANSSPTRVNYTLVQSVSSIAAAGATDGATTKGNAGFDSANFTVSNTGWVQLKGLANPYGESVSLDSALAYVQVSTVGGGVTTYTVNTDNADVFGPGAQARNVKAEVIQDSSGETVYTDVRRNASGGDINFDFIGSVAEGDYYVLLTYV